MPKLPSKLKAAYSDFRGSIKAAKRRAGTSQGMPEVYKTLEVFLDAWNSDPQRKAELNRRARFVKRHTRPDSPYGNARAQAVKAALPYISDHQKRQSLFPTRWAMMSWKVLQPRHQYGGHALAEALGQERAALQRVLGESTLPAAVKKKIARWDKKAQAVESEARQLRADGCWYLTHPSGMKFAERFATKDLLNAIGQAATALVGWFEEREASEGHLKGAGEDAPKTPPKPARGPGGPTPSGAGEGPQAKRSTERGEARTKIIAALNKHHKYREDSCLNLEPIGGNVLARKAKVSKSSVSRFFKKEYDGYSKYKRVCQDTGTLINSLKVLNQEMSPRHLYSRNPPGEVPDDEE